MSLSLSLSLSSATKHDGNATLRKDQHEPFTELFESFKVPLYDSVMLFACRSVDYHIYTHIRSGPITIGGWASPWICGGSSINSCPLN